MSLPRQRLAATLVAILACALAGVGALAGALPDSTWVALPRLPQQGKSPVFALAVDPANNQVLVAGNSAGGLLRSVDGGATWTSVHSGRAGLLAVAFSPIALQAGLVLAGASGSGALVSKDGGVTWAATTGVDGRDVRVFGFSSTVIAAGTDRGVYISADRGLTWAPSGLQDMSIDALTVAARFAPVRLFAGSDSIPAGGGLPLFQSVDAGSTWTPMNPAISGAFVSRLAAGGLPPTGNVRSLVVGTNAGLFLSADNGATFSTLSGGSLLPPTDYTQIAFVTDHYDTFYTASDGGGSNAGGLWWTGTSGGQFISLLPPLPSVTALAVSNDEAPILYVATFRPSDHAAALWAYHDTGGPPNRPPSTITPTASGSRIATPKPAPWSDLFSPLLSSQAPYVGLGVVALVVIALAVISHLRGVRR